MCGHEDFDAWVRTHADALGVALVVESYSFREMSFTVSVGTETPAEFIPGLRAAMNNAAPPGTDVVIVVREDDVLLDAPEPTSGPSRFDRAAPV